MHPFWQKWLRVASIGLVVYGALMALTAHPVFHGAMREMLDMLFWPPLQGQPQFGPYAALLGGILGAAVMGWGAMSYFLVTEGIGSGAPWAYRALWVSILTWYLADGTASWIAGAPVNILGNTVFALIFGVPLLVGRRRSGPSRQNA